MTATPFADRLDRLMVADRHRLGRRLESGHRLDGAARQRLHDAIAAEIEAAERRLSARQAAVPSVRYPDGLPVSERREEISAAIAGSPVVIVAGETGSGKSTQIPKICLELGRGVAGFIGHTQPRRLAARTVAERIAEELSTEIGGAVGYAVRFTDRVGEGTLVKVMTDGILLAEIGRDRLLTRYDTIIVDEAHERSLNIDFILGYLKSLLPRRPDLKVVVTSATIDTERFSAHFGDAPVVSVSGRSYPVEMRYRPIEDGPVERDQVAAICDAVDELRAAGPGDILVFLSGEREIRDTADALGALDRPDTEVLPLFARLSVAEQHRVFQPHPGRRVVLATNVAETSLTVPGVRYVVDPGTARISRYNRRTKVQRLPIEAVSQASANQRAGRCGRVAPGICVRLYAEDDFAGRPEFTEPEILRTNLASVILQMAALGLGDMTRFPFLDPPDARNVRDGIALLEELGALTVPGVRGAPASAGVRGAPAGAGVRGAPAGDRNGDPAARLTPVGRRLAQLPLDPRFGRMILEAEVQGCLPEVLVVASALSVQDPRERPLERAQAAAEAHGRFTDAGSDFVSYLRLWAYLQDRQAALSSSAFRRLCKAEFLHYLRVREWQDLEGQLRAVARTMGIRAARDDGPGVRGVPDGTVADPERMDRDGIHRAVLAGLLSHIGLRPGAERDYLGARNARFALASGSALAKRPPKWVMAAELVETNRLWARVAAGIEPEWAEALGDHLVKRTYSEPHWDARRGSAMAFEGVTLYGLPIVAGRKVDYGRVEALAARELFIHHALIERDWVASHAFLDHNDRLVNEVRALEDRVRHRGLLVDEDARLAFYDRLVPSDVTSSGHFDRWWKATRPVTPHLLDFNIGMLTDPAAGEVRPAAFPDTWKQGDVELALSYEFAPGSPTDGVTVTIPLPLLARLEPAGFEWQVPGLRLELLTELIRSLPKALRRNFVPAPDYARAVLEAAGPGDGPLFDVAARHLTRMTGDPLPPSGFDPEGVPAHLRMGFRVVDESGSTLATGKHLGALRDGLSGRMREAIAGRPHPLERTGATTWEFGTLPAVVDVAWAGHTVPGYPALVDEGATVGVRVFPTAAEAAHSMWMGTTRLLALSGPSPAKAFGRLPNDTKLALARSPYPSGAALLADCAAAAAEDLMVGAGGPASDAAGFDALLRFVREEVVEAAVYVATVTAGILVVANSVELRLDVLAGAASLRPAVADMGDQLARLVHSGFVATTGVRRLADVLRYLSAIERRLDKLAGDPRRDRELMGRIRALEADYQALAARPGVDPVGLAQMHWSLEELRVSVFAQSLGTARPVSEQRIRRDLDRLGRPNFLH